MAAGIAAVASTVGNVASTAGKVVSTVGKVKSLFGGGGGGGGSRSSGPDLSRYNMSVGGGSGTSSRGTSGGTIGVAEAPKVSSRSSGSALAATLMKQANDAFDVDSLSLAEMQKILRGNID